jgi:starch synthase
VEKWNVGDQKMHILFVAAENGVLGGGKVGGIGDVIQHLPPALAAHNCRVTVVTPSHGFLHLQSGAVKVHSFSFLFRGYPHTADIYEVRPAAKQPPVTHLVIHHPALGAYDSLAGKFNVYTDDPPDRPFFTDAARFALFGAAVSATVCGKLLDPIDCIHLHDWHAAFVALLRAFHPDYAELKKIRLIYTIHNLALQGVRPLRGNESSLAAWFPELNYDWSVVADPRWPDCFNAMAIGIRLADAVHTVSPSYAEEIQKPSQKPQFYGGEGLESDLIQAGHNGRLTGILNGCDYPAESAAKRYQFPEMLDLFRAEAIRWTGVWDTVPTSQFMAYARALELGRRFTTPAILLTSVSRIVDQKVLLLRESGSDGKPGLQGILEALGENGCYLMLGNGDRLYEKFLTEMSSRFDNFLFINGFSEQGADALYAGGDLFLMPSSYEPCGLSQMLAMRCGQPCLVHEVGGLKDTVQAGRNGFTFKGENLKKQVDNLVQTASKAIALKQNRPAQWRKICEKAAAARFRWRDSAAQYIEKLYRAG